MAGIIQKSCVALLPLWSLKKSFVFFLGGEAGRTHANQQKRTKNLKLKFNKKSFSIMTTVTIIIISVITKIKNSSSNNSDY